MDDPQGRGGVLVKAPMVRGSCGRRVDRNRAHSRLLVILLEVGTALRVGVRRVVVAVSDDLPAALIVCHLHSLHVALASRQHDRHQHQQRNTHHGQLAGGRWN
jgi:hypothetical protein